MNCTEVEDFFESGRRVWNTDAGFHALAAALGVASGALLVAGASLIKPLSAVAGLAVGAIFSFVGLTLLDVECVVRLVAMGVVALLTAVTALCVVRSGILLVTVAGAGAAAHFVYDGLVPDDAGAPFRVLGASGWYVVTLGGAAVAGCGVGCCFEKHLKRVASALLGGAGVALTTHLVAARHGARAPPLLLLALASVAACAGVAFQLRCGTTAPRDAERGG